MNYYLLSLLLVCSSIGCFPNENSSSKLLSKDNEESKAEQFLTQEFPKTVGEIAPPNGFKRKQVSEHSFQSYLRTIPLHQTQSEVLLYSGEKKYNQNVHAFLLDIDVGKKDLQQCADAAIRLHADFLYDTNRQSEIKYHFTNGMLCTYTDFLNGKKFSTAGGKAHWIQKEKKSDTPSNFRAYLDEVYMYAGTASLPQDVKSVEKEAPIEGGQVFHQARKPFGHVVIILDVAWKEDTPVFLLAQSYMPAQTIHILKNYQDSSLSPWYRIPEDVLETPEWTFKYSDRKEFLIQ